MAKPDEAERQEIAAGLKAAGWVFQDTDSADLHAGQSVAIQVYPLNPGHDFADDLHTSFDAKAAGVIEAKKAGTTQAGIATQAAKQSAELSDT